MPLTTSLITTVLFFASLTCHFFVGSDPDYVPPSDADDEKSAADINSRESPEVKASFPSLLVFSWFTGFAWLGFKRPFGFDDLWDLPPMLLSKNVVPRFISKWVTKQPPKKKQPKKTSSDTVVEAKFDNEVNEGPEVKIVAPDTSTPQSVEEDNKPQAFVLSTIIKAFGGAFAKGSILKLIHDILVFLSPLLLKRIIGYAASEEEQWKGVIYALGLLLSTTAQSVMLAKYFYDMYVIGIWIRTSLTSAIYRKSLRVSPQGKSDSTTGEVVNLMSVDSQRVVDMMVI
jgi:ATP-binding cassette subfamily C (CFTR/MRP) protein 1